MRLDYLRYFNHLAKVLNFTKAAEDLFVAQPTLSVAIKRMEQELGVKLFKRGKGSSRIELTESGAAYYEYVSLALNNLDTGLRVAREIQGEANSLVRVGTVYSMQGINWSQAMQAFLSKKSNPPKISIEQSYSPELIARLRKGELDVVFAARMDDLDDLNYIYVWSQPLVLGVHRNHPLAKREKITLDDLKKYEILTYPKESPVQRIDIELPVDEMNLLREYDDEITMSTIISSDENKLALFCHSFLVNAFSDVVCRRIEGLSEDFHKVYLVSRKETHLKVVDDYISFMSAYSFPNILETGTIN
ncbi:MAG: LysR family transcriptional regulator [Eggerthellaceae bacterium]|nr:LysR family transcriptional regulator [Eggerthellaceae bacterium]